ncbi:MAG: DUF1015 domain-containing protein [Nanoarchaeota archaeon]|nr:DUF1015 domain-containing protein [Nanoarchaeota archaeon]
MVNIFPFKGVLYNKEEASDFSKVITPPNDVISGEQKKDFKGMSPYNFVNLILPNGDGNKYENSVRLFEEWQKKGVLVQDKEETIYVYSQSYSANGNNFKRTGFMALIQLEDWGKGVLPHEKVLEKDLQDRISLISTTKANFGVPFILYGDGEKVTDKIIEKETNGKEPYIKFSDGDNVKHKLWKASNKGFIEAMKNEMKKYQCIMADGHHRYTSELKVKEMLDIEGANYGLMCFVNSFNEGMTILPTNRVVFDLNNVDMNNFLDKLQEYFEIEEIEDITKLAEKVNSTEILIDKKTNLKNHVLGVYSNINKKSYFLRLKDRNVLDNVLPENTDIYKKLDVNILHKIILEKILGITEEQQKNREHIDFIKGNEDTIERTKDENIQFAFFTNPPLMREVFLVSRAGETTPQKSTCFYPKVFSGLVTYKMEGN